MFISSAKSDSLIRGLIKKKKMKRVNPQWSVEVLQVLFTSWFASPTSKLEFPPFSFTLGSFFFSFFTLKILLLHFIVHFPGDLETSARRSGTDAAARLTPFSELTVGSDCSVSPRVIPSETETKW